MLRFTFPGPAPSAVTLHHHSDFSDGHDTLAEMCRAGKAAGFRKFGISDHWVMAPFAGEEGVDWSIRQDRLAEYVQTVQALQRELNDDHFQLLLGLEVDYFPENFESIRQSVAHYPFDYLIGSVHYVGEFSVDNSVDPWLDLTSDEVDKIYARYWELLAELVKTGFYTVLGHLDLPKKFAFYPRGGYESQVNSVLAEVAKAGMTIELNTAGWDKPCAEQYPSLTALREANRLHIPVVVDADAHSVTQIGQHFARAEETLRQAGYILTQGEP